MGVPGDPARNGHSQPRRGDGWVGFDVVNPEESAGSGLSRCEDAVESAGAGQAGFPGQTQIVRHRDVNAARLSSHRRLNRCRLDRDRGRPHAAPPVDRTGLSGKALAAAGATCVDDCTTRTGCHASTESVPTGTLDPTGLKCTLHESVLDVVRLDRSQAARISRAKKTGKYTVYCKPGASQRASSTATIEVHGQFTGARLD